MTKVLVIDDEDLIRHIIVEVLEEANFQVIQAEDGQSGVELALEQLPDIILCDVMMPKLDGYEVLHLLKSHSTTANIPFIFLTARHQHRHWRQGMELGADDYLIKPCTATELLNAIATRLQKHFAITHSYTTALKHASQQLRYSLHYDALTGLPNRLLLRERFDQTLQQLKPHSPYGNKDVPIAIAVFYLGLDRFKRINETLGHGLGNFILQTLAERLVNCIDSRRTLGRLDADEFAIIVGPITDKIQATAFAKTILDEIRQPISLKGEEIVVTASLGIAFYPNNSEEFEDLLGKSHKAMAVCKQSGGNQFQFYTTAFHKNSYDQLTLETALRYALERKEFEVYYQPQISIETGKIVGAEALLRWHHPEQGMISPAIFIPLAEESGLIEPIGEWVLQTACQQVKYWQEARFNCGRVAVNLSGRQLNQNNLGQRLVKILTETEIEPECLELELTESILVHATEKALENLNILKSIGVKIAIDDFGTGYSSLIYLQQFPFDILKIDRRFIRHLDHSPKNQVITKSIIKMAHELNLKVIAEGVEDELELSFLKANNCDEIQGYLFSPPLTVKEFEKLTTKCLGLQQLRCDF